MELAVGDDAVERSFELADVALDLLGDELQHLVRHAAGSGVARFELRIAIRVSRSGSWMSAISPHSKRERKRASSVGIALGGRSLERTIWPPPSWIALKV